MLLSINPQRKNKQLEIVKVSNNKCVPIYKTEYKIEIKAYLRQETTYLSRMNRRRHECLTSLIVFILVTDIYWVMSLTR